METATPRTRRTPRRPPTRGEHGSLSPDPRTRPPDTKLERGQREEEYEEDHGERARLAGAEVQKDLLVDRVYEEVRRASRPALRHDAHDVECLKARHERRRRDERGGRREERRRDIPEARPRTRAVEGGRFVQRCRDALQPREENDHRVPGQLPDADESERWQRPAHVA